MPLTQEIIILCVPRRGARFDAENLVLPLSLVFSPVVRTTEATGPEVTRQIFEASCDYLANWTARTDWFNNLKDLVEIDLTTERDGVIDSSQATTGVLEYASATPLEDPDLWNAIFDKCWVLPESAAGQPEANYGSAATGDTLRRALRQNQSTIEGISSSELSRLIACHLATGAALPTDGIPTAAAYDWNLELRRVNYAIERRNQQGTAGGVSATHQRNLNSAPTKPDLDPTVPLRDLQERKLGEEFHRRISMVSDYPHLGRKLGLIVDVQTRIALKTGEVSNQALPATADKHVLLKVKPRWKGAQSGARAKVYASACRLRYDSQAAGAAVHFFAAGKLEYSRLLDEAGVVNAALLDTAQWDLDAGVRATLRKNGYLQATDEDKKGQTTAPDGYGLTVFWDQNTGDLLDRSAFEHQRAADISVAAGKKNSSDSSVPETGISFDAALGKSLYADDLVLGYVPALRATPPGEKAGEWRSLTHRSLRLEFPTVKIDPWEDEMALLPPTTEAQQPLAGWVVDIVHRAVTPSTAAEFQTDETWYYLVAVPTGFVLVQELLNVSYKQPEGKNDGTGKQPPRIVAAATSDADKKARGSALFDLLPSAAHTRARLMMLGQFVEFRGGWVDKMEQKLFDAHDAALRSGTGLAGRLAGQPIVLPDDRSTLVKLPIRRRQVRAVDAAGTAGNLPVSDLAPTIDGPLTYAYLQFPNRLFVETDFFKNSPAIAWSRMFFQGRGKNSLVVIESEADRKNAGELLPAVTVPLDGVLLRCVASGGKEGPMSFGWEPEETDDGSVASRSSPVKLQRKAGAVIQSLFGGTVDAPAENSVYRVYAEAGAGADGETTLLATRIVEEAPAAAVTFTRFRIDPENVPVAVFGQPGQPPLVCLVTPETRVTLTDDGSRGYFDALHENPAPARVQAHGSWAEMGARIGHNDQCKIWVRSRARGNGQVSYVLDRVEVLWTDANHVQFGFVEGNPSEANGRTFAFRSVLDALPGKLHTFELTIDDATEIVSMPAVLPPTRPWRQWHRPPPRRLLRIYRGAPDQYASRIEVINVLDTFVGRLVLDTSAAKSWLKIALPGTQGKKGKLALSTNLHKLLSEWQTGQTPGVLTADLVTPLSVGNLLRRLHAVTARLSDEGEVETMIFTVPGQAKPRKDQEPLEWVSSQRFEVPGFPERQASLTITIPHDSIANVDSLASAASASQLRLTLNPSDQAGKFMLEFQTPGPHPSVDLLVQVQAAETRKGPGEDAVRQFRSEVFVLRAPEEDQNTAGSLVPLFVEVAPDESAAGTTKKSDIQKRREKYFDLLTAGFRTGYPLVVSGQTSLVIEDAAQPAADWELMTLPLNADKPLCYQIAPIENGPEWMLIPGLELECTWSADYPTGNLDSENPQKLTLVTGSAPDQLSYFSDYKLALHDPKMAEIQRLAPINDQILAHDVLLQFNGWSLAVPPPRKLKDHPEDPQKKTALPITVRLAPETASKIAFPLPRLRVGSKYDLCLRVMDVAGNVLELNEVEALTEKSSEAGRTFLSFAPFGKALDQHGREMLRFNPSTAPVVWSDVVPDADGNALATEVVLLTNRAGIKFPLPKRGAPDLNAGVRKVVLKMLPPPAHWHTAECLGAFDRQKAADSYQRIRDGRDWVGLPGSANPATTVSGLQETVADPDVRRVLVVGHDDTSLRLLNVAPAAPATLTLEAPLPPAPFAPPVPPVMRNQSRAEAFVPPTKINVATTQAKTGSLIFPEDIDTEVRIFGVIEELLGLAAAERPRHFLHALAAASDTEKLRAIFYALRTAHGDASAPKFNLQDFTRWAEALSELKAGGTLEPQSQNLLVPTAPLIHPWVSTPRPVRVRHVTNQPFEAPELVSLLPLPRRPGQTEVQWKATVSLHRPSTGTVSLQAALEQEYTDDERFPLPSVPDQELLNILEDPHLRAETARRVQDLEMRLRIADPARSAPPPSTPGSVVEQVLGRSDDLTTTIARPLHDLTTLQPIGTSAIPDGGDEQFTLDFRHDCHDTRHRTVYYRPVGHSRHGHKFFGKNGVETRPATLFKQDFTDTWMRREIDATASPDDVDVPDITVLFRWKGGVGQGAAAWAPNLSGGWTFSRTRYAGHRVWLGRPWYSSGSGEKLAFLLWLDTHVNWSEGQETARLVSRWGRDPVFETEVPSFDAPGMGTLKRTDFLFPDLMIASASSRPIEFKDEDAPAPKADAPVPAVTAGTRAGDKMIPVGLAVYTPRYHPERQLWYVDVFVDREVYTPFVAYTVARYQPCALPECALSNPKRLRMLQILPQRTLTLHASNRGLIEIKVELGGIFPAQNHRRITIQLETNPFLEERSGPPDGAPPKTPTEDFTLGWKGIPVIGTDGRETDRVELMDREACTSPVQTTIRLSQIPLHHSRWAEHVGGLVGAGEGAEVRQWPCRFLRLTLTEDEIYPCAHGMPEDQTEAPRRIYSEQVLLPADLLAGARTERPVEAANHAATPPPAVAESGPAVPTPVEPKKPKPAPRRKRSKH